MIPIELTNDPIEAYSPGSREEAVLFLDEAFWFWEEEEELMEVLHHI